jgi:heme exporter protein A
VGYNFFLMQSAPAALRWSNVSKSYGRQLLFRGISGQLTPGKATVVTGQNGSGKSTFLRIVSGLAPPDSGTIERSENSDVGYFSPSLELYGDLTGRENLDFFAAVSGVDRLRCVPLLSQVGLTRSANKLYGSYSSGMKQRLKLAFAALRSPTIMILDEPTLALDSDGVAVVDLIIRKLLSEGGSALIATNDPAEVDRWADATIELGR